MSAPTLSELEVGQEIGTREIPLTRTDLVTYAGASGDTNPIHWNEAFARSVELPGVIAHGMLTFGAASGLVGDWAEDPGRIVGYSTRFSKPVPVEDTTGTDEPGAVLTVTGKIGALDPEAGTARVDLTVTSNGAKVLMKTQAVVRLVP
ncbi:MaoC family dehydratase [Falsarthrobacter nasiphocae]|uniref:Acyl dehydratase n=1 Tax=Falsarthrobacter nasiphocae TaxID=189863 RepID=A0AAE3YIC8_9MICC|nr:MaoC family dehydratase [Falsarthrobacter nasiphocae]MDR6892483.1 acyl dehydratase [Falsarthrobacter nasiphocae]